MLVVFIKKQRIVSSVVIIY